MKKFFACFVFSFLLFLSFSTNLYAQENNQFITIVNPVRISRYTQDPSESLKSEYQVVMSHNLPASWLLTYDALVYEPFTTILTSMDNNQELGLFLEITPAFAQAAGVEYNKSEFWHHANSVFLSGYLQEDRKKMIDTVFEAFKQKFGYYPKSVGAWWIDSYSLSYMHDKYGIIANLGVSDQFATDNYKIWGTYWSTPFISTKNHAAIPAEKEEYSSGVVTLQWAPRDPLNGYYSSLYSTQDYLITKEKLDTNYFENLVKLYATKGENQFGQVVVGLEADLGEGTYAGEYNNQLERVANLISTGEYEAITMEDFAAWYQDSFKTSPPQTVRSTDLLGGDKSVIWYQSRTYRVGLIENKKDNSITVVDLRAYLQNFQEPYFVSPNREKSLTIQIPAIIDSINNEEDTWTVKDVNFGNVKFDESSFTIEGKSINVPKIVGEHPLVKVEKRNDKVTIKISNKWNFDSNGMTINDFSAEAKHILRSPKAIVKLLVTRAWDKIKKIKYFIPAGEIEALMKLSVMPQGSVLVYDNECLQCAWHTSDRHPAFAGIKKYIAKLGKKRIVKNKSVFEAKDHEEVGREFAKTGAHYIYLVKFEDYRERYPFSPGDLGVRKVYDNANAEIWEVER